MQGKDHVIRLLTIIVLTSHLLTSGYIYVNYTRNKSVGSDVNHDTTAVWASSAAVKCADGKINASLFRAPSGRE